MKPIYLYCILLSIVSLGLVSSYTMKFSKTQYIRSNQINMLSSNELVSSTLSSPPTTFIECARKSSRAARLAIDNGEKLVEVEFPPLPLQYLEDSSSSARDISDANTRWAVEFAKAFTDLGKVSIIYPDQPELDDAIKYVDSPGLENPYDNVTLATIRSDSIRNAKTLDQILLSVFGATVAGTVEAIPNTKVYIAVVSSTQELPDLKKLHEIDSSIPIVFFNLKLDILRGDLGLPVFPGRDLHYEFLTKIRPVFIMRSRAFSTSLRRPPFVLNYSGLLYKCYPEKYQCILNTGNGKSKTVKVLENRPTSQEFRDSLIAALDLPGFPKDELKTRGGDIWWEKDLEKEKYSTWRM